MATKRLHFKAFGSTRRSRSQLALAEAVNQWIDEEQPDEIVSMDQAVDRDGGLILSVFYRKNAAPGGPHVGMVHAPGKD